MRYVRVLILIALLVSISVQAGSLKGKVTFEGVPAPETEITRLIKADVGCAPLHANEKVYTTHYVIGPDKGLKWVFVYIKEGLDGQSFDVPADPVVLDQVKCVYEPHVFGIQAGQTLQLHNGDPFLHNVHIIPGEGTGNQEKNIGMPFKEMKIDHVFQKPEIGLRIKCDVHKWMFAYAHVIEHPFHDTTGDDGSFEIKDIPPGKYKLAFWHKKMDEHLVDVEVTDGETSVDFTFTAEMMPERDQEKAAKSK